MFVFIWRNFAIDKFEGTDFKSDNRFFKLVAQKILNKVFLIASLGISIFYEILKLAKFEVADFGYDKDLLRFEP